jgi:hypothetical protein
MKRTALLVLVGALLLEPSMAAAQCEHTPSCFFPLSFAGLDYETGPGGTPDPPGEYLAIGDGVEIVGFVTCFDASLIGTYVDFSVNEYTFFLTGLQVATREFSAGLLRCTFTDHGRLRLYSDPLAGGTPADYGTNPPNGTVPSTFTDGDGTGTMQLGGDVTGFSLAFNFNTNSGAIGGEVLLDEGPLLDHFPQYVLPPGLAWPLSGLLGVPDLTDPLGYNHPIAAEMGMCFDATTHPTWGALKALYR